MRSVLVALALLLMSAGAHASSDERERLKRLAQACPLVHMASVYVLDRMPVPALPGCPLLVFDAGDPRLSGRPADPLQHRMRGAAYYPAADAILLSPTLRLDSPEGLAVVIHQVALAHVWHRDGADCRAERTRQAYVLEAEFLADSGLVRAAELVRLTSDRYGTCVPVPEHR